MDVFEAIKNRRSVRVFEDRPVPEELIEKIIDAGRWAPSATNRQAWKFIIVDSPEVRSRLLKETTAYFVGKAPVLIFVLYSNRTDNMEYKDHLLSAAMAVQNMQLAAYALGIGSCCVNNLPPKYRLRRILNIPGYYDPVSLLCLGYPKGVFRALRRKGEIDEIRCKNIFIFKEDHPRIDMKLNVKRVIRYVYYRLPAPLKQTLDPIARKFEKRFDK
jgi:nitroreductase